MVRQAGLSLAAAALSVLLSAAPTPAADTAKVGTCLLASCQKELVGCLADANCAKNLVCLQTCNGRPDETDCQVCQPSPRWSCLYLGFTIHLMRRVAPPTHLLLVFPIHVMLLCVEQTHRIRWLS